MCLLSHNLLILSWVPPSLNFLNDEQRQPSYYDQGCYLEYKHPGDVIHFTCLLVERNKKDVSEDGKDSHSY